MTPASSLENLIRLATAATPGPWQHGYNDGSGKYRDDGFESGAFCITTGTTGVFHAESMPIKNPADPDYIAACSPERIAELCREVLRAREVIEWYANWDWSDKYVQAVPKRAKEFLKGIP